MEKRKLSVGVYETTNNFRNIAKHACVCYADDLGLVAVTGPAEDKESQEYADLFAASQDMLEALESAEACLRNVFEMFKFQDDGDWLDEVIECVNKSSAIIAKARGAGS